MWLILLNDFNFPILEKMTDCHLLSDRYMQASMN